MSFWENKKKAAETNRKLNWHILETIEQLKELHQNSFEKPQIIFKHSTHCGTSAMAKFRLEEEWDFMDGTEFYYLDLINHRSISNAIAEKYQIRHQSPQLLVIHQGVTTHHVSHHRVSMNWLNQAIAEVA